MSDRTTRRARMRAAAATIFFGIVGIALLRFITDWGESWPLVLFYAIILTNTYFSIRTFASIAPARNIGQQAIDAMLAICMFLLALNFNSIINFAIAATLLFIVATLKYILLVKLAGYSKLLYMKIKIDALGTLYCFLAVLGTLWGYGREISAIWAIGFVAANIYVLWLNPHYLLEHHHENG